MEESWVNAALSQHEYDTSHSGNQHGSVRSHFVQLQQSRQTITGRAIHDPKSIAVRIGRKCIHQACLYLRSSQNMQQYGNLALTDTRSHTDSFPILPLPNTDHPPINLPRFPSILYQS